MQTCKFDDLPLGEFFTFQGATYRKILHAKSWSHAVKNIIYYNAIAIDRETEDWFLLIDREEMVETLNA